MSDSCHVNPLQQLGSKNNNLHLGNIHQNTVVQRSTNAVQSPTVTYRAKETAFLNQSHPNGAFQQHMFHQHHQGPLSPMSVTSNISATSSRHDSVSEDWLNQFSAMKVRDPLEFNDEYKKLYEKYAGSGGVVSPESIQMQSSSTHMNQRPLLNRQHQSGFLPSHPQHAPQQQWNRSVPLSAPPLEATDGSIDSYFDLEFTNIEAELHQRELQDHQRQQQDKLNNDNRMNFEQAEFQKVATDIVRSCTPDVPASPTVPTSQLHSKFASSKFMGLMRKVSDGVVTIKKTERELFTPETGEVVGNEYFPVLDERQEGAS